MLVTAASTALGYSFDVLNRLSSALNDLARSQNQIVLAALLLIVLAASMTWLGITGGRKRMDVVGKHMYITGGSSGLGLALAKYMASKGASVTIVARDQKKLDEAKLEIQACRPMSQPDSIIQAISADLSSYETSNTALQTAISHPRFSGRAPDHVFLCAGFAKPGFFVQASERDLKQGLEGVYWVAVWTAQAASRLMVEQGKKGSKIVIVSSLLALTSFAGYSAYAPAKYALRGLAETLRSEFLLYGIDIHLYLPAGIFSAGYETENLTKPDITKKIEEDDTPISPEECVKYLIAGIEKGHFQITNDLVTDLLRVSGKGAAPANNWVMDCFKKGIADVGLTIWRMMTDAQIRKHAPEHEKMLVAARQSGAK